MPTLRLPLALTAQLLADGHTALMIFDASTRHRLPAEERAHYEQLLQETGCAIEAPSGRSADGLLLKQARATGASIVSRDHYAEHRRRYRKLIDDTDRLHAGWVRDGCVNVPSLALSAPLAESTEAALQQLRRQLQSLPAFNGSAVVASRVILPLAEVVA